MSFAGPLHDQVEIAWRLLPEAWEHGYATEAARACLGLAAKHGIESVVAFTTLHNLRSQRVMERLGMEPIGAFDHPELPAAHSLSRHVLYRITLG